ncbi:MAG: TetR/AcrR family transcriptional regulator [Clostridia bacterium]|nr:TetR/AcrR family transcriptional regulator [Clostridia bacterium]
MAPVSKKLEKKMKIIDTAFSLFREHSVNATAVDDIVKAAGIARGTFYLYFKDKSDLLEQIILYKSTEYMKAVLKSTLSDPMLENGDFYERVRAFLNCYIDFLIENKEILPVMEKNLSSCIKHLPEFYDSEIADIYRSIIDRMVSLGYTPDNAHITTLIIVDMTGNVCSDAIMYEKPFPIEKIRDIVVSSAISIIRNNARLTRGEIRETLN